MNEIIEKRKYPRFKPNERNFGKIYIDGIKEECGLIDISQGGIYINIKGEFKQKIHSQHMVNVVKDFNYNKKYEGRIIRCTDNNGEIDNNYFVIQFSYPIDKTFFNEKRNIQRINLLSDLSLLDIETGNKINHFGFNVDFKGQIGIRVNAKIEKDSRINYNLFNSITRESLNIQGKVIRCSRFKKFSDAYIQLNNDIWEKSIIQMFRPLILIVDDEEAIRFLYSEELIANGYSASTLEDGFLLLEIIGLLEPDLIVLDIKLGGYNGLDLLQDIRGKYYDIPVILCTAYDTFKEDVKSMAADFYVIKSFDTTELKNKIKIALENNNEKIYTPKMTMIENNNIIEKLKNEIVTLKEENKRLKEATYIKIDKFTELQTLIHGWIHDITGDLIFFQNIMKIATEKPNLPQLRDLFDKVNQAAENIKEKKTELYDYLDYGFVKFEEIDIISLIQEEYKKNVITNKNLVLKLYCKDRLKILGNKSQVKLIINNIINNATKYSIEDHAILLEIKKSKLHIKNFISISITNVGPKIQLLKNKYNRYPLKKGDIGLGIPLSKYLINNHKGKMKIDATSNGTKIEILLPLIKESQKEKSK